MNLSYGRYEQYELRMQAIARIIRWIIRFKWCLISGALLITATFTFLGVVPGMFTQHATCLNQTYGAELQYSASAILSDVSYEFATQETDAVWSAEVPVLAGTYRVRAVSHNGYGKVRYSKEALFTILPAPLELKVVDRTQTYGDLTEYAADHVEMIGLQGEDRLGTVEFTSADISVREMSVLVSAFTVVNSAGEDVSACYQPTFTSGSLFFERRVIGLSSNSVSKQYDGVPLEKPDCQVSTGALASGNVITYIHDESASVTTPGTAEAKFTATITDEQGRDVTDVYQINYEYGTLTVTERPLTIAIPNASKAYDGTPLVAPEYKIIAGALPVGSTLNLDFETENEIEKVGETEVHFTAEVFDAEGKNVSEYYALSYSYPTLTVTPRQITLASDSATKVYDDAELRANGYSITSGSLAAGQTLKYIADPASSITNAGTADAVFSAQITTASGEDVTDQYAITYQYGKLTVEPRHIEIRTISAQKIYDGKPLKNDGMSIVDGTLISGHKINVTYALAPINAGTHVNNAEFKITNASGINVTDNYDIKVDFGILQIDHRQLTISTDSAEKVYDDKPLTAKKHTLVSGTVAPGQKMAVTVTGTRTDAGQSPNTFNVVILDSAGNDVTDLGYRITKQTGNLKVLPRPITVTSKDASKVYDGTPLTKHEVTLSGTIVSGHEWRCTYTGSQTEVGSSQNTFTVSISSKDKGDVAKNYDIKTVYGTLTVTPKNSGTQPGGTPGGETPPPESDALTLGIPRFSYEYAVMQVEFEKGGSTFLRQMSYGDYTGSGFAKAPKYAYKEKNPLSFAALNLNSSSKAEYQRVAVYRDSNDSTSYWPYYATIALEKYGKNDISLEGISRNTSFYTATDYDYRVFEGVTCRSNLTTEEKAYRDFVYRNYLSVPESTAEVLRELAEKNGIYEDSKTLIRDIQAYIQHAATYNLQAKQYPHDVDHVVYFLTVAKEGVCQQYAASATLMYRLFGIPARFTTGYSASGEAGVRTDVMNTKAHAWVEIYLDGIGWVAVEVTGGGYATEPEPDKGSSSEGEVEDEQAQEKAGEPESSNCDGGCEGECDCEGGSGSGGSGGSGDSGDSDEDVESGLDSDSYQMNIPDPEEKVVMQVTFEKGGSTFLRRTSYGDYNGSGFDKAPVYTYGETNPLSYAALNATGNFRLVQQKITVYRQSSDGADFLPYYTINEIENYGTDDISIDGLGRTCTYTTVRVSDPINDFKGLTTVDSLTDEEKAYRDFVYANYLSVPESTAQVLLELAEKNGISKDSPTLISDIKGYIQNAATYNMEAEQYPKGVDQVVYFLTVAKEGVCQQYAASATLMYRLFGIPARFTAGYSVNGAAGIKTDVMSTQAHAWVEIYLDGIGWVALEVTGGGYAIDPNPNGGSSGEGEVEDDMSSSGGSCDGNCNGDCEGCDLGSEGMSKIDNIIYARVRADYDYKATIYLRELSYGDYTGSGWKHAKAYSQSSQSNYPLHYAIDAYNVGKTVIKDYVVVWTNAGGGAPLIPYYTNSVYSSYYTLTDVGAEFVSGKNTTGYSYRARPELEYEDFLGLKPSSRNVTNESKYRIYVRENYLSVPQSTKTALLKIARQNGLDASSPDLITDIQEYIQNCAKYNQNVEEYPEGVDVAIYFLSVAKEGNCQHFATAATLMYRALGIPARFTTGFLTETSPNPNTLVNVKGEDAHAWVEIYLNGIGWIKIEVTPVIEGVPTVIGGKTVQLRPDGKFYVEVMTPDIEKVYDGNEIDAATKNISMFAKGDLLPGHRMEVVYASGAPITPGQSGTNGISEVKIYDANGLDVTELYQLKTRSGKLTILKRPITINSSDATKKYDGTPLTSDKWWISSGSLLNGHSLVVTMSGHITNEGTANNYFSYYILDENGKNVTTQYDVRSVYGVLKVTSAS